MSRELVWRGMRINVGKQARPPFKAIKHDSGLACVVDANGINWISFPDKEGATLFYNRHADEACEAINQHFEVNA